MHAPEAENHSYSMRLVRPFLKALRSYPSFPLEILKPLEAMDVDDRVPIGSMVELLRGAILVTGDEDLGLKAAREIEPGDYGALEYAAGSAATVRDALEVVIRYSHLVNDALTVSVHVDEGSTHIRLDSAVVLSRAATEFQSAAFYVAIKQRKVFDVAPRTDAWFSHAAPSNLEQYALTFRDDQVHFDKPWNGFVIETSLLDQPLRGADSKLHALIRRHAEALLGELPRVQSFTENVRTLLTRELSGGDPSAANIAKVLHMSARTLARRLEDEGTTFKELVEDLRRRLALRYVGGQDMDISEVALLLGFSDSSSFYRAFKRWTNQTPLHYRRAQRA